MPSPVGRRPATSSKVPPLVTISLSVIAHKELSALRDQRSQEKARTVTFSEIIEELLDFRARTLAAAEQEGESRP